MIRPYIHDQTMNAHDQTMNNSTDLIMTSHDQTIHSELEKTVFRYMDRQTDGQTGRLKL